MDENYSVIMALQDYMPVALSSVGMFYLARFVARHNANFGKAAYIAWILTTLGGASKATWKLLMALSEGANNVTFLNDSLFYLMGAGFTVMAFMLWYVQREASGRTVPAIGHPAVLPIAIVALFTALSLGMAVARPEARTWYIIMLALTTVGNFATGGLAIRQSLRQQDRVAAALFAFNLVAILMLTGMARIERTIALEWVSQISNTISNGAFAYAAYRVAMRVSEVVRSANVAAA